MLGGIYGDLAGSIYEYNQIRKIKQVKPQRMITESSFYSDDTIETIAVMDAVLNGKSYEDTLREYILKYENYKPNFTPYFKSSFSPGTIKWAHGIGTNDSIGNGAMMRISPIGYLFDNEKEVIENARLATIPSHNSEEAINSATIIALMIYYFRKGYSKETVYKKLKLLVRYEPFKKFNTTCHETLNNCLFAIYVTDSFYDSIRCILSMGGDTDTNACIVGSVTEALYRLSKTEKKQALDKLPDEFVSILKRVYK